MFLRDKILSIVGLVAMALLLEGSTAFSQYSLSVKENDINLEKENVDSKAIKKTQKMGLDFARKAIKLADPYPSMKTEVNMRNKELNNLTEKKSNLKTTIQRLKIGLMRKKAKFARNPELLKVSVKQYSQKIAEMEDELAEVEKQIPVLESKLESVTIEVEAEELKRGIMKDEEDTGGFDEEFEEAIQGRWEVGKALLHQGF